MENIRIGMLILNYKSFLDTEKLVRDILAQDTGYSLFIQVVDNASPNESYAHLSEAFASVPNVSVVANGENSGYAKGNNVGLRLLEDFAPHYVIVLNNDVRFSLSLLDKLVAAYRALPDAGVIAPMQCRPDGSYMPIKSLALPTFWQDVIAYTYTYQRFSRPMRFGENTHYRNVQRVGIIPGSFFFISYPLFRSIGFFDEYTFLFCEERFVSRKLRNIGRHNYLLLDCSFVHDHSRTINSEVEFLRQLRLLHDGRVAYTRHYRSCAAVKTAILNFMWGYLSLRIKAGACLRRIFGRK